VPGTSRIGVNRPFCNGVNPANGTVLAGNV
jgi:hypothetical protein